MSTLPPVAEPLAGMLRNVMGAYASLRPMPEFVEETVLGVRYRFSRGPDGDGWLIEQLSDLP